MNHYHVYYKIEGHHSCKQDFNCMACWDKKVNTKKEAIQELTDFKKAVKKNRGELFSGRVEWGALESKECFANLYAQKHDEKCNQIGLCPCCTEQGITWMGFECA